MLTQVLGKHSDDRLKTTHYLTTDPDLMHKILNNGVNIHHVPQKLPMVCEPKEYVCKKRNKLGGYLLNDECYTTSIIKDRIGYGVKTTLLSDIVVNLVNGVSKIPFKINTDILDYIYRQGIQKKIITDDTTEEIQSYFNNPHEKTNYKLKPIISKIL